MDSSVAASESEEHDRLSFLWNGIVRTILYPLLKDDNRSEVPLPGENIYMSPILSAQRFDKQLFPYIYKRLPRFVSNYYIDHVLPPLLGETNGLRMVISLLESWNTCAQKTSVRIEQALKPLEEAYRRVVQDVHFTSIRRIVIHQFHWSVFDKLLSSVQRFGFSCISRDGIITDRDGLWSVHSLIELVSLDTKTRCSWEWDVPVMNRIFGSIGETINSWNPTTVKSFLKKVGFRLLECRSVFMYRENEFEAKRLLLRAVSGLRDKLIFDNDAANLRNLLQNEESVQELKMLFRFFDDDQDFLRAISTYSGEIFKEFLGTGNHESDDEPFRKEGVFRRFLLTWKRMHSIQRNIKTRRAFDAAILDPLTRCIGNFSKTSKTIYHTQNFLAEHCHSLLSKNGKGKQELATSREEEIFEIISLAAYMGSTDIFVEAHRVLLSKRLLTDTSESKSLETLVLKVFSKHDSVYTHGIKMMLSDAQHWPLYQNEIFGTFGSQHSQTLIETKIINRRYWELEEDAGLELNPQLQMISKDISGYFKSKKHSQVCSVHSTAGHAIIKTKAWDFKGDSVRIKLTTGQLSLFSLFEKSKQLYVRQICTLLTAKEEKDVKEFVFNLIRSMTTTVPILEKKPNTRNVEENDMIYLNKCFRPNGSFLTLPIPQTFRKLSKPEGESPFEEEFSEFQKQFLETTIVKVLKEKMTIEMNVLKQVVFSKNDEKHALGDDMFEKAINGLENREFLSIDGHTVRYVP